MNELSLFTGYGGFSLGLRLAGLDVRTVGYVEIDPYCQAVIQQRILDGFLDDAPIFPDIRAFDGTQYRGLVDIITAGFPCQPHSVAGQRRGAEDERNLWPDTLRIIREVGPRFAVLENVPGLLVEPGYAGTVVGELAEAGYDCIWDCVSAAEVGAPHLRYRWWCLAYPAGSRCDVPWTARGTNVSDNEWESTIQEQSKCRWDGGPRDDSSDRDVAHPVQLATGREGFGEAVGAQSIHPSNEEERERLRSDAGYGSEAMAYTRCEHQYLQQWQEGYESTRDCSAWADAAGAGRSPRASKGESGGCSTMGNAEQQGLQGRTRDGHNGTGRPPIVSTKGGWWETEPEVGRVADGVTDRVGQFSALGNGILPKVVERFLRQGGWI